MTKTSTETKSTNNGKFLHHYTCLFHVKAIAESGYLKLTDSIVHPTDKTRNQCLWTTTVGENIVAHEHGLNGAEYPDFLNKTLVKLTMRHSPHYKFWLHWSIQKQIPRWWQKHITKGMRADTWWISERPVPLSDVVQVEYTPTGELFGTLQDFLEAKRDLIDAEKASFERNYRPIKMQSRTVWKQRYIS